MNSVMKRVLVACLLITVSLILSSCAPRGESNSLDEVLADAKARYSDASKAALNQTVSGPIGELSTTLAVLETGRSISSNAQKAAELLSIVTSHAGYTSRPGLDELSNQYRALSQGTENKAAAKLLVARTYRALASELETTKFSVRG